MGFFKLNEVINTLCFIDVLDPAGNITGLSGEAIALNILRPVTVEFNFIGNYFVFADKVSTDLHQRIGIRQIELFFQCA